MTTPPTIETTDASSSIRRAAGRALAVAAVVVGLGLVVAAPAGANLGDPVDPQGPGGTATTSGDVLGTEPPVSTTDASDGGSSTIDRPATTDGPATSEAPATTDAPIRADGDSSDDDGGTSLAALGAVGVVAFLLGVIVAAVPLGAALSKRKSAAARPVAPPPAVAATPPPGGIVVGPAPARDSDQVRQQRVALAEGLIGLRDHLPSEALSTQAATALASAGIVEISPLGQQFDPAQHKAVHQVATDDPAQHNVITAVERPGYADGTHIIRLPEVVVARHGGGS